MPYRQCRRAASKTMKNKAVMTETNERKLPVGIQSFKKIREEGYLYVDKTEMVWNLANKGARYDYLSRPRRFGKSVLVDTLQCYFEGRKELFEGLKIMEMEKDWTCHPVIRLDMRATAATTPKTLRLISTSCSQNTRSSTKRNSPTRQVSRCVSAIL